MESRTFADLCSVDLFNELHEFLFRLDCLMHPKTNPVRRYFGLKKFHLQDHMCRSMYSAIFREHTEFAAHLPEERQAHIEAIFSEPARLCLRISNALNSIFRVHHKFIQEEDYGFHFYFGQIRWLSKEIHAILSSFS
jgi:hypothetical protein